MELQNLFPEKPEFTVKKTGKSYSLRKVGAKDHAWLIQQYGSKDAAKDIFRNRDSLEMARFVYHLLDQSQRLDFPARDESGIDDDGESFEKRLTGPEVLLDSLEDDELVAMLGALTRAMILGNPEVEPLVNKALEDGKKKHREMMSKLTGDTSLTSLQVSGATQ